MATPTIPIPSWAAERAEKLLRDLEKHADGPGEWKCRMIAYDLMLSHFEGASSALNTANKDIAAAITSGGKSNAG